MSSPTSANSARVILIAFDGGPCGGKSTGINRVRQRFENVGIPCLVCPESATALMQGGIKPGDIGSVEFQEFVTDLGLGNERIFARGAAELAKKLGKTTAVMLCDRGLVGQAAYLPGPDPLARLDEILRDRGMSVEEARARYAGVIHIVTSADGAEEFYTLENNAARTESPDLARELDKKTLSAWLGHPHVAVVGNVDRNGAQVTFEEKIDRVVTEAFRIIGYPVPLEIEDKYLLESFDAKLLPVPYEAIDIEQTYLVPEEADVEERVRARRWLGSGSYYHTIKKPGPKGARIEIERLVGGKEYRKLLERADPSRRRIVKKRHCFVWQGQYFEVDVFGAEHEGLFLAERERTDHNDSTELPPFLRIVRDVTDDKAFRNATLAARAYSL